MARRARLLLTWLLPVLPAACSDGAAAGANEPEGAGTGDLRAIVPEGLDVAAKPGGCGELELSGLTLKRGAARPELLVSLRNAGTGPICSPAFSAELIDADGQSVATALGGLLVKSFYRLTNDAASIAACVAPGDSAMAVIEDLPEELALEDVRQLIYYCNFWELTGEPLPGLSIAPLLATTSDAGVRFSGTLRNELDTALANPEVVVFPLSRAGRPLAAARSAGSVAIAPGGSWQFETGTVSEQGDSAAAYPAHGP